MWHKWHKNFKIPYATRMLECSNSDASEYFVKLSWLSEYIFRHTCRQWYPCISSFVTHLHKTSHKSPNKMAKKLHFI